MAPLLFEHNFGQVSTCLKSEFEQYWEGTTIGPEAVVESASGHDGAHPPLWAERPAAMTQPVPQPGVTAGRESRA